MNKLNAALSKLVGVVFSQYERKGGRVTLDGNVVESTTIASLTGVTPALVWLAEKFYGDFNIPFPDISYRADAQSQLGYVIDTIQTPGSASPFLLMMSDFLTQEVVPDNVAELDLDVLAGDFREWCVLNVRAVINNPSYGTESPDGDL